MAQKTFRCRLITPEAAVLDTDVTYASVPAWDGLFGVLPGRAPIVAKLGVGELRLEFPDQNGAKGGDRSYFVQDGFVRMAEGVLTVLAGKAQPGESLSESDAQAELAAAEARTVPGDSPDRAAQSARIAADRQAARVKLRLARASKGRAI